MCSHNYVMSACLSSELSPNAHHLRRAEVRGCQESIRRNGRKATYAHEQGCPIVPLHHVRLVRKARKGGEYAVGTAQKKRHETKYSAIHTMYIPIRMLVVVNKG